MPSSALLIRPSLEADLPAITAIYAHHVMHGTGSFEIDAPDLAEMTRRRADVLAKGLPHLVASRGAEVLGFAYAGAFRPRPAFRFMAEDSVYIHADHVGLGMHHSLGFAHTGILKASGWKHGRWLDTVFMQKTLGAGDSSPASELTPSNR